MEEELRQRPGNCIKVVLYGPESTGKSTLVQKLAAHYHTKWIPEYAREYLQNKWDKVQKICEPADLLPIAKGQMRFENDAAPEANRILFCDTDLLQTKVYGKVYYGGWSNPAIDEAVKVNRYDLYLLTYIDTPWEPDDLRDRPEQREEMFSYFVDALVAGNRPFLLLKGSLEQRLKTAINHINTLLS